MFDLFLLADTHTHTCTDCSNVLAGFHDLHNSFLFYIIVDFDSHVQFYRTCCQSEKCIFQWSLNVWGLLLLLLFKCASCKYCFVTKLVLINNQANKRSELLLPADVLIFLSLDRLPGAGLLSRVPPISWLIPRIHRSTLVPTNGSWHGSHGRNEGLAPGVSGWMGEVAGSQLEPTPTQDCSISG